MAEPSGTVTSRDGTPIAVWRSGSGPPLLLVHGTTADHSRWAPALPAFEQHFTVLAMDRRGRGGSGDQDDYAIEREFEDVAAVVDWAGDEVSVLGHSYGALCALEAARLTDRIAKLVLYEPPLNFVAAPPEVVERLETLLAEGRRDELIAYFMEEVAGLGPEQVEVMRSMPSWQARLAAAPTIAREERGARDYSFDAEQFREIRVPTLFLEGGDSPDGFRKAGDAVEAALPDCGRAVMPGQRHNAMDTATDMFVGEVLGFLRAA